MAGGAIEKWTLFRFRSAGLANEILFGDSEYRNFKYSFKIISMSNIFDECNCIVHNVLLRTVTYYCIQRHKQHIQLTVCNVLPCNA